LDSRGQAVWSQSRTTVAVHDWWWLPSGSPVSGW
jgi:hypothetical protein